MMIFSGGSRLLPCLDQPIVPATNTGFSNPGLIFELQLFRKFMAVTFPAVQKIRKNQFYVKIPNIQLLVFSMVYRHISADMKCRALQLFAEGWETERIAEVLGISEKSFDRWLDNYEVHGHVAPRSANRGRRRLLTQDVIEDMQELLFETPDLYLDEIADWLLLYHDLPISKTALHDNLRDLGLSRKLMQRTVDHTAEELEEPSYRLCVSFRHAV